MLDWIEEGVLGDWSIEHFEISKTDAAMYAISCYGSYEIPPTAGKYTRLRHAKRGVVMSDTRQELWDLYGFKTMIKATSDISIPILPVHISGLGLGIFTKEALDMGRRVEVVEIEQDVIDLVGGQLIKMYPDRLTIIHGDALEWRPAKGSRYSVAWHDIWDVLSYDNYDEYKLLRRRWGRYAETQGVWADYSMRRLVRQERVGL